MNLSGKYGSSPRISALKAPPRPARPQPKAKVKANTCGTLMPSPLAARGSSTAARSRLRAAVDDPRAASGLGINVPQVFAFTFAFGCGLAGLGGALSAEILGLDPYFPLKFMIYFLIVVTVGGSSSITGPF